MKIFISWSGDRSNKIAETLKIWIKSVIQSAEPFVSSQDIQKGARWSTDIAKELKDCNFGILCVTKDNFKEPWLLFEAGALSKAMDKSFVVPLLFDLQPSELSDSPLLQFQAASFSKDDIKKTIISINNQGENKLDTNQLENTFNVWYPNLEENLNNINLLIPEENGNKKNEPDTESAQILEEILTLTRDNQKLLRNPESNVSESLQEVFSKIERTLIQNNTSVRYIQKKRNITPMMLEELFYMRQQDLNNNYGILIALSLFKDDFPWIYDYGKELLDVLKSEKTKKQKKDAIKSFIDMMRDTERFSRKFYKDFENGNTVFSFHEVSVRIMEIVDRMMGQTAVVIGANADEKVGSYRGHFIDTSVVLDVNDLDMFEVVEEK